MVNIYLYRKISLHKEYPNPYIANLEDAISRNFNIVNKTNNEVGVLDLFRYLFKTDIFYFNWIETLPQKRFGKLQTIIFFIFLFMAKCFRKKICWTLHNKYSHNKSKNNWTDLMYKILIRHSDLILTHSQSGVDFVKASYPAYAAKVKYIIHPVLNILPALPEQEKEYDFLIWGTIQPYKGIVEFLQFINENGLNNKLKILIVGKCNNEEYKALLNTCLSENITYYNDLYEIEEIAKFANQSKFILFTYKLASILSSGSLMDSVRMGTVIIGPNDGAFKDLNNYNFVYNYDNFQEIIDIHKNHGINATSITKQLEDFCDDNTWEKFSDKLKTELQNILT